MKNIFILILGIYFNVTALNWYVDNTASGSHNGTSWTNAWQSFSQIVWASLSAGDSLLISGGTVSKTYGEELDFGKSGTVANPIVISVGQASPHNGILIIDGTGHNYGMDIRNDSNLVINGKIPGSEVPHIKIVNATYHGVNFYEVVKNIDLSYIEATLNNSHGLYYYVTYSTNLGSIHHCKFHDNAQGVAETAEECFISSSGQPDGDRYGVFKFHHNEVYNTCSDFIKISVPGTDFYNNLLHTRLPYRFDHPDGIQVWTNYLRIYNNKFYDFERTDSDVSLNSYIRFNPQDAIAIPPSGAVKNILVYNNEFTETVFNITALNYFRGFDVAYEASGIVSIDSVVIINNTFVGIPFSSMIFNFGTLSSAVVSNVIIENNIIKNCAQPPNASSAFISIGDASLTYGSHGSGADIIIDYNIVYASSGSWGSSIGINGVTYTYPNFKIAQPCQVHDAGSLINPLLNTDYTLQLGSPAIDQGTILEARFATDIAGIIRPFGSSWDIGANEYHNSYKYKGYSFLIMDTTVTVKCSTFTKCKLIQDTASISTFVKCDSITLGSNEVHNFNSVAGKKNRIRSITLR